MEHVDTLQNRIPVSFNTCTICLENLSAEYRDKVISRTRCGHTFHRECLHHWIKNGTPGNSCPLCKQLLHPSDFLPQLQTEPENWLLEQIGYYEWREKALQTRQQVIDKAIEYQDRVNDLVETVRNGDLAVQIGSILALVLLIIALIFALVFCIIVLIILMVMVAVGIIFLIRTSS